MYNFPGEFFQSEQRAFIFSVFLFLYLASKPSILYCEQSNRERTQERAAKLFPAPRTRVVFRGLLSSDFSRLPQVESLSAGYLLQVFEENGKGEIKTLENEVGTRGRTERNLPPLFSLPTSCSRAPYDIPLGSVV